MGDGPLPLYLRCMFLHVAGLVWFFHICTTRRACARVSPGVEPEVV